MAHSRVALIAVLLLFAAAPAVAREQDEQLWLQVNTVVPLGDTARLTLEQIGRFSDRQNGLYQTEFGGILGYRVGDGVELGFGYRKVGAHNGNTGANEDRLRQHIVLTRGSIAARLRVDERFHPRGDEIGFRIRPLLRYNQRLRDTRVALFASHESFFLPNGTSWGQRRGYERMRNAVGVTLPVSRSVAADVGYLNQYRFARGRARAQMDHALSLQLTINLAAAPAPQVDD